MRHLKLAANICLALAWILGLLVLVLGTGNVAADSNAADAEWNAGWRQLDAHVATIGPVQGASRYAAFSEVGIAYTSTSNEPGLLTRLLYWDENRHVGDPVEVWQHDTAAPVVPSGPREYVNRSNPHHNGWPRFGLAIIYAGMVALLCWFISKILRFWDELAKSRNHNLRSVT
jgi:hypothetical protein